MNELKIRAETLAQRCEICHQADCFDALENYCSRCISVSDRIQSLTNNHIDVRQQLHITQYWIYSQNHLFRLILSSICLLVFPPAYIFVFAIFTRLFGLNFEYPYGWYPYWLIVAMFVICSIINVFNRTVITTSEQNIFVNHRPFPVMLNKSFNKRDIISISAIKSKFMGYYFIKAELKNHKHKTIINFLTEEKAHLIERNLNEWLMRR